MSRILELKYNNKVYTFMPQIEEILIKEKLNWILDCEIDKCKFSINNKVLIFESGVFYSGRIKFIIFNSGQIKSGILENGIINNGLFSNLTINNGLIKFGKFHNCKIENGKIENGEFYNCNILPEAKQTIKENFISKFEDFTRTL